MKLISKRIYLDYNATAPLADTVQQWLASGALPFGNPSSVHTTGKKSKKLVNDTSAYLKSIFGLQSHALFYHSGATEGINNIVKGFCFQMLREKSEFHFVSFSTDHSCVFTQKEHVELLGGSFHLLDVDKDGHYNKDSVIKYVNELSGNVLINFTLVNNETGVIWNLADIKSIKDQTNAKIHVDAVQLIGKTDCSFELSNSIDFYTFSGHKFGAMKGVGFTFADESVSCLSPLITGGGQQGNLRSGTENTHGIYSLKLALEEVLKNYQPEVLKLEKEFLEKSIQEKYGNRIHIVAVNAKRNYNTIYLIVSTVKIDIMLTAFDMAQIDVSSGSACSSGTVKASRVLLSMGYSEEDAKNSIRISLPYNTKKGQAKSFFAKIESVFDRFIL